MYQSSKSMILGEPVMAVRLDRQLHHNHSNNSREIAGKVMVLQGDYGIGDPQLDHIASLIENVNSKTPIEGNRKMIYLFSSLGTIEYALEMSGYSQQEIAALFTDKRNLPQCLSDGTTVYIDYENLNLDKFEGELQEVLNLGGYAPARRFL